jgi:hypothetical protein
MADILIEKQSVSVTPSTGQAVIFVDSTASILAVKDASGVVSASSKNAAIANQGAGFATDTYLTNSDILIPSWSMQAKTVFKWTLMATKTAAGVATPIYNIRIGSLRTTGDTTRLTLTGPAQTAIVDKGILTIIVTVRSVGASGVIQGNASWQHTGTAASSTIGTGFANDGSGHVDGTSAGFDNSNLGGSYIGLSINGGASASWTVTQVIAEAQW